MDPLEDMDGSISTFGMVFIGAAGLIALVFLLMLIVIVTGMVKGVSVWNRNNNSPLLTTGAVLLTKRQEHSRTQERSTTRYFVAFELQGHERLEFQVPGPEWGTLVEGDRGQLTYQGSRYKGFARTPQDR